MEAEQAKVKVRISWPRPEGEIPLWIDLCLARGLRAIVGKAVIPGMMLPTSSDRLQFEVCDPGASCAGEHAFSVVVADRPCWPGRPHSLDMVAICDNQRLRWEPDFGNLLRAVEADRLLALAELRHRPMLDSAMRLAMVLALGAAEAELLCVLALIRVEEALEETFSESPGREWPEHLAAVLGARYSVVRKLLGRDSDLLRLKLVPKTALGQDELDQLPLRPILASLIRSDHEGRDPLSHFLAAVPRSRLSAADFSHLPVGVSLIVKMLRDAHACRRPGVNVLLHGVPGTGKTQLSRLLADLVEANAFEVPLIDESGNARSGYSRVDSLELSQQALSQHERPLLIFDEAEDLFPPPQFIWVFKSLEGIRKGWINRMLETNPAPTIWIANTVGHIDPSFLRRFDLVVEVPSPPCSVRQRLLDSQLGGSALSCAWRAELAGLTDLSPDEIERLARTSVYLKGDEPAERERALHEVFEQVRKVSGRRTTPVHPPLPEHYRPEFINADVDLNSVAAALCKVRSGRLCLYGPPGSGKTAFVQHLSERLGAPLQVKRASDLLDKYIGGTEKSIAAAFKHAADDGAILLIDEADTLLRDRERAQHSWEISQVNELLTQMERFEGVLVMCTNLFDQLDAAALRRFDIKVKLNYLRADQRLAMFDECVGRYAFSGNELQQQLARDRLARLDRLTPGDFQTVLRRRRLVTTDSVVGFIDGLAAEQAGKRGDASRSIGFVRRE